MLFDNEQQARVADIRNDEDAVLMLLLESESGDFSLARIAEGVRWSDGKGQPYRSRARRAVDRLHRERLVAPECGAYALTPRGVTAAKKVKYNRDTVGKTCG